MICSSCRPGKPSRQRSPAAVTVRSLRCVSRIWAVRLASSVLPISPGSTDHFLPTRLAVTPAGLPCPAMLARRSDCQRGPDQGAAAVEFALVVPVLIFLLLGIIDYGLFFTNALAVRAGVSDAARQISVGNFAASCDGFGGGSHGDLEDKVDDCISPIGATVDEVSVEYSLPWTVYENVTVCAEVAVVGLTGFTPMPNGGVVSARASLPIQQATAPGGAVEDSCD